MAGVWGNGLRKELTGSKWEEVAEAVPSKQEH